MTLPETIGTIGVFILLFAYFLNLTNKINRDSKIYLLMNFTGAALACYASLMIKFFPFVVLEGTWCLVSLMPLLRKIKKQE